ncbi:MAG: hypothetical protein LBQ00_04900 [Syntrophobacterales bacterium]|jgi:hypothetical protein|nr:hypothetical protein [Syntrophobacterales bacterium]
MVKKTIKETIKKPDMLIIAFERAFEFIQVNLRLVIIAAVIFCAAGLVAYGYYVHEEKRNEEAQIFIANGVKSLESYYVTGKKEDIEKAESAFGKVAKEGKGKSYMVAQLYLGTVYAVKGQTDDAKKVYQGLSKKGSPILKMLSEKALQNLDTKN